MPFSEMERLIIEEQVIEIVVVWVYICEEFFFGHIKSDVY